LILRGGHTQDYIRHGNTTLFAVLDLATGEVLTQRQLLQLQSADRQNRAVRGGLQQDHGTI
jgi:hypothetical protein